MRKLVMPLNSIQPSQLYISKAKLPRVNSYLEETGVEDLDPLPIKKIGDIVFFTDGHTRAFLTDEVYDLLLSADPSREIVDSYIDRGKVFVARYEGEIIGEYVLLDTRPGTIEIVNIAVKPEYQGKGLGKLLLKDAITRASTLGAKTLEIGTGNSSLSQLALYQKAGFKITGIDKDFFVRHYNIPIVENGIQCLDMIRLSMELAPGGTFQSMGGPTST